MKMKIVATTKPIVINCGKARAWEALGRSFDGYWTDRVAALEDWEAAMATNPAYCTRDELIAALRGEEWKRIR